MYKMNFSQTLIVYYLMMAVVIIGGFTGLYFLMFLALPLFFIAITGSNILFRAFTTKKSKSGHVHANQMNVSSH